MFKSHAFSRSFGLIAAVSLLTACGSGGGGSSSSSAPPLTKGSGMACPAAMAGTYSCEMTEQQKREGAIEVTQRIEYGQDEQGRQIVNFGGDLSVITDGEIHEQIAPEGPFRYSVNCQANSIQVTGVGSGGQWFSMNYELDENDVLRHGAKGFVNGRHVTSQDTCTRKN